MGLLYLLRRFVNFSSGGEYSFLISHLRIGSLGITASSYDGSTGHDMTHSSVILIYQSINAFS